MLKLLHITREEMAFHLRQRSFYLTVVIMPLLFAALGALPQLRQATQETPLASVETIFSETELVTVPTGYVDYPGIIAVVPEEQAEHFQAYPDEAGAAAALAEGEIESYYVIAADYLKSGLITQYSNDPQLLTGEDAVVERLIRDNLLRSLEDDLVAARYDQPVNLVRTGPSRPVFSFIPTETDMQQLMSAGLVVLLFAYFLNVGGSLLLRALQREVQARVLEVLVVSTTPGQLIGGKLLGLTTLTGLQAGITLLAGAVVYGRTANQFGPAPLPLSFLLLSLPYLMLGYLAYCGLLMGVSAVWPNLPESATLLAAVRLLALGPLLGVLFIIPNPDSPISAALTLLPPTAPLLMPFRLILTEIPAWQWVLGLLLLIGWAAAWIWLSLRLFRAQSLLTGRSTTPKALWHAMRG